MILVALRHPPTCVAPGCALGRVDVPLAGTIDDAVETALMALRPWSYEHVWTSPLSRCAQLAALIASNDGLALTLDDRLLEFSYGEWEGQTFGAIEAIDGPRFQAWMSDWQSLAPPGGESAADVERRVLPWVRLLEREGGNHLLVAHAGIVRALRVIIGGLTWPAAMDLPVPHLVPEVFGVAT